MRGVSLIKFFGYNFTFQQLFVDVVGSRIRLVAALESIENLRGICKAGIKFQIEIEGQRKPALEGVATFYITLYKLENSAYSSFCRMILRSMYPIAQIAG